MHSVNELSPEKVVSRKPDFTSAFVAFKARNVLHADSFNRFNSMFGSVLNQRTTIIETFCLS